MKLFKLLLFTSLVSTTGCGTKHAAPRSRSTTIEEKYSILLGVNQNNISNKKLYSFIDDWYGVPYRFGGKTKKGVDCSGFSSVLFREIYGKELSGSSLSLYNQCRLIPKGELQEGDLVFFKIDSKEISHVGVYLQNNKFVHATTKAGVMIDGMEEEYYRKYFFGAGRLK
ncbi:MAG: glycoside hydrolase [Bacteroidetes bacterium]|nr:MAG: glycoside hydrolase [Bacteroidota bacterium]